METLFSKVIYISSSIFYSQKQYHNNKKLDLERFYHDTIQYYKL
jgi:hypothetical protein